MRLGHFRRERFLFCVELVEGNQFLHVTGHGVTQSVTRALALTRALGALTLGGFAVALFAPIL